MKKITIFLLIIVAICYVIDTAQPGGNQIAQFVGGLSLFGLTLIIIFGATYLVINGADEAKINSQYKDRLPPAPTHDITTIRPREGGPIPNYVPKWQRFGKNPDNE